MNISWHTDDISASTRQARIFLIKSSMVFLAESLNTYVEDFLKILNINCKESKAERLDQAFTLGCSYIDQHKYLLVKLLLLWRNKIVHGSNVQLYKAEKEQLKVDREIILAEYCNLDIEILLSDYEQNRPTLKEASSFSVVSIQVIRCLDSYLISRSESEDIQTKFVSILGLDDILTQINKNPDPIKRNKKLNQFYLSYGLKK